jgi:hypothetical protein
MNRLTMFGTDRVSHDQQMAQGQKLGSQQQGAGGAQTGAP